MAGASNNRAINGPSLSTIIDSFEQHLSARRRSSPEDISEEIENGWDAGKELVEDLQDIIDKYRSNPMEMAEKLQRSYRITIKPEDYNNPEPAILNALKFRDVTSLEQAKQLFEAQEQLADSLSDRFSNTADMVKFMVDNRDAFTQSTSGIEANGTNRPAMNDMGFIALAKSGNIQGTMRSFMDAGAHISIEHMQSTWENNPEGIESTFFLNNSIESLYDDGVLSSIGEYAKNIVARPSRHNDKSAENLEYANSVYGSNVKSLESFLPFVEAQEQLADQHFGGDKVKMAQFFVEHHVSGPASKMPFAAFVKSGEAAKFIEGQRSLSEKFERAVSPEAAPVNKPKLTPDETAEPDKRTIVEKLQDAIQSDIDAKLDSLVNQPSEEQPTLHNTAPPPHHTLGDDPDAVDQRIAAFKQGLTAEQLAVFIDPMDIPEGFQMSEGARAQYTAFFDALDDGQLATLEVIKEQAEQDAVRFVAPSDLEAGGRYAVALSHGFMPDVEGIDPDSADISEAESYALLYHAELDRLIEQNAGLSGVEELNTQMADLRSQAAQLKDNYDNASGTAEEIAQQRQDINEQRLAVDMQIDSLRNTLDESRSQAHGSVEAKMGKSWSETSLEKGSGVDPGNDAQPIMRDPSSDTAVKVQPGDSLSVMIQDHYKLTKYSEVLELMPLIMAENPQIKDAGEISTGDTIKMPTAEQIHAMRDGTIGTPHANNTPDPALETAFAPA